MSRNRGSRAQRNVNGKSNSGSRPQKSGQKNDRKSRNNNEAARPNKRQDQRQEKTSSGRQRNNTRHDGPSSRSHKQDNRGPQRNGSRDRSNKESTNEIRTETRAPNAEFVEGKIDLHPDGFGFLITDHALDANIYIGEESLKAVMHRDRVKVRVSKDARGRVRGQVVAVIKRASTEMIGIYRPFKGGALVIPFEAKDRKHSFKISEDSPVSLQNLKPGTTVVCRILKYPDMGPGLVSIDAELADPNAASVDTLKIVMASGWPRQFTRAALSEAENAAQRWKEGLSSRRKDLRSLPLVTIDGRDARDFDDAVCAKREGKKIRLWVAIADVSLFVQPGTALDREAFERATSVYFPDHVIPMLPEVLSNGVCSLNPFEDRACMVSECVIGPHGEIESYEVYEGLMCSARRLTYEQMQAFMDNEVWATQEMATLSDSLSALIESFQRLHAARVKRGALDLDLPEALVLLQADGTVRDIQTRTRLDAHRLIEECMLAANQCTANFLKERIGSAMYRVHEIPDEKKIGELLEQLALLKIDWQAPTRSKSAEGEEIMRHPRDFARLLDFMKQEFLESPATQRVVNNLVLRTLKQARYAVTPLGHFALALDDYTHFTSPIRRYPDLVVHRLLKSILKSPGAAQVNTADLEGQARHSSDQERSAMDMERKLIDVKKCRFIEPKLGEEFEVVVSNCIEKGLFCTLEEHFVDGLVSSETLERRGRYRFDAKTLSYQNGTGVSIRVGSRLKIQLAAVSVENRKIDFELLEVLRS